MGSFCSKGSTVNNAPSGGSPQPVDHLSHGSRTDYKSGGISSKTSKNSSLVSLSVEESKEKQFQEPFSFQNGSTNMNDQSHFDGIYDGIPRLSRVVSHKSRSTKFKVSEMSSLLGRAGTAGLGKAVEVLDTLGSSMTNLNLSSGFATGAIAKGNKISILAFEVANTIVKGSNLMQSVSKENVKHLKEVVLPSEGVQHLVSKDMDELLRIAAADKREELKIFSGEVVRFGNRCRDPQWHNLDHYFGRLGSEFTPQKQLKDEAETVMQQLMVSVQYTAELYHKLLALGSFEQDYRCTMQEDDNSNCPQRGDNIAISRLELKTQRKHVRRLKKASLWCKNFEEVIDKLLDIVHYIHREINDAFGSAGQTEACRYCSLRAREKDDSFACAGADGQVKGSMSSNHKLGPAGLALHYANLITQIDTLVSCSSFVPPNTRDSLYQGLPPSIKSVLRSKLQSFQVKEQFTVPQIKSEMEKILQWLVPIATNTMKAHHVFGWACTGSEVKRMPIGKTESIRIQTLYHADKEKTEAYILYLVVWLHHLICQSSGMNVGFRSPIKSPIRSLTQMAILHPTSKVNSPSSILTDEDREMLQYVDKRKLTPGINRVRSLP